MQMKVNISLIWNSDFIFNWQIFLNYKYFIELRMVLYTSICVNNNKFVNLNNFFFLKKNTSFYNNLGSIYIYQISFIFLGTEKQNQEWNQIAMILQHCLRTKKEYKSIRCPLRIPNRRPKLSSKIFYLCVKWNSAILFRCSVPKYFTHVKEAELLKEAFSFFFFFFFCLVLRKSEEFIDITNQWT